jgi:hypothetical protein
MRNDDGDKHNPEAGSGDGLLGGYVLNTGLFISP